MPTEISSLSPEVQKALSPSLLHIMKGDCATKVNIITTKSGKSEGEVAITIAGTGDTPTEV